MAMTHDQAPAKAKWRKMLVSMAAGAVSGGVGMTLMLTFFDRAAWPDPDPSRLAVASIGLIYALMGLIVGAGILAPGAGAKLLNVEDRDELIEQRAVLAGSAVGCVAIGAALILLGLAAGIGGPVGVSPSLAFGGLVAALLLSGLVSWRQWRLYDELMRSLIQDGAAMGGYLIFFALTLWGAGSATGVLAAAPQPLDLVSLAFGLMLLGCFIAIGRRGMLMPR